MLKIMGRIVIIFSITFVILIETNPFFVIKKIYFKKEVCVNQNCIYLNDDWIVLFDNDYKLYGFIPSAFYPEGYKSFIHNAEKISKLNFAYTIFKEKEKGILLVFTRIKDSKLTTKDCKPIKETLAIKSYFWGDIVFLKEGMLNEEPINNEIEKMEDKICQSFLKK